LNSNLADNDNLIYDRREKKIVSEIVLGGGLLGLAYKPVLRHFSEWVLFRYGLMSRLLGWYCDLRLSRSKIAHTIEVLKLDCSEFRDDVSSFKTFNQFFYRHLRPEVRPFSLDSNVLVAPADARYTFMQELDGETFVPIKGVDFTVKELLGGEFNDEIDFSAGSMFIARLCPADYHRYHYPTNGKVLRHWLISGRYHSVNPIALALGIKVFTHNYRQVTLLDLDNFGKVAFVEVGAFGVSGIEQTHTDGEFKKMDEKGYFTYGGSTIVMIFERGKVQFDDDILRKTTEGYESLIRVGESIGLLQQ